MTKAFDFKALKASAVTMFDTPALFAIVLGESGSGKSSLCGTVGEPTLYIYARGESHGPKAARSMGADILPMCIDHNEDGTETSPDDAWARLIEIVSQEDLAQHFKAIIIDGAPEIEDLVRKTTKYKNLCLSDKGKHSVWEEPKATSEMFKQLLNALKRQQSKGVHVLITCLLNVREFDAKTGAVAQATPTLKNTGVAADLVRQFDDILVIGRATIKTKDGELKGHFLQFDSTVTKVSKDADGAIKRMVNFAPRISGVKSEDLKEFMKADLKKVIEFKKEKLAK